MLLHTHTQPHPTWSHVPLCGRKCTSHTETEAEKQCNQKKQPPPVTVLWHPTNHHTHIKTKNRSNPTDRERKCGRDITIDSLLDLKFLYHTGNP